MASLCEDGLQTTRIASDQLRGESRTVARPHVQVVLVAGPDDVHFTIAVVIARRGNPIAGAHRPDQRRPHLRSPVHDSVAELVRSWVIKQHVRFPIAVHIANTHYLPASRITPKPLRGESRAVARPHVEIALAAGPDDVRLAITIEVADSSGPITRTHRPDALHLQNPGAVHQPVTEQMLAGVVEQQIVLAVPVHVTGPDHLPPGRVIAESLGREAAAIPGPQV